LRRGVTLRLPFFAVFGLTGPSPLKRTGVPSLFFFPVSSVESCSPLSFSSPFPCRRD
jgi:hypothetical protein